MAYTHTPILLPNLACMLYYVRPHICFLISPPHIYVPSYHTHITPSHICNRSCPPDPALLLLRPGSYRLVCGTLSSDQSRRICALTLTVRYEQHAFSSRVVSWLLLVRWTPTAPLSSFAKTISPDIFGHFRTFSDKLSVCVFWCEFRFCQIATLLNQIGIYNANRIITS